MRVEDTLTLEGFAFKVRQLPTRRAQSCVFRLSKVIAPLIAMGAVSIGKGAVGVKLDAGAFDAMRNVLQEEDFNHIVDAMIEASHVSVQGGQYVALSSVYDQVFIGAWGTWLQWMGHALKVNFASFLTGLGSSQAPGPKPEG